jgi:hypothetical protein
LAEPLRFKKRWEMWPRWMPIPSSILCGVQNVQMRQRSILLLVLQSDTTTSNTTCEEKGPLKGCGGQSGSDNLGLPLPRGSSSGRTGARAKAPRTGELEAISLPVLGVHENWELAENWLRTGWELVWNWLGIGRDQN